MSHTRCNIKDLVNRIRQIGGQIDAVERAPEDEAECARAMQLIASTCGSINGLMAELMEERVRNRVQPREDEEHGVDPGRGTEDLIEVMSICLQ